MTLTRLGKLSLIPLFAFVLMAAKCEQQDLRFVLKKMPTEYRQCAAQVVPQINKPGPITQKDLILYTAELKKYAGTQNRCLKGAINWADAQWNAYYQFSGQ